MKKTIFISLIIMSVVGCSKNDTIQPVITLVGSNDVNISLNGTYTEQGATAQDDTDGDISSSIVVSGTVNTNLKGLYHKYYDVTDAAGNKAARVTRNIHVVNDADYLVGTYTVTPSCGATPTSQSNSDLTTSNTVNNEIYLSALITPFYGGAKITGTVSGNSLDFPAQTINGNVYAGNGTITGNNSFNLDATSALDNLSCNVSYVKQ